MCHPEKVSSVTLLSEDSVGEGLSYDITLYELKAFLFAAGKSAVNYRIRGDCLYFSYDAESVAYEF